MAPTAMGEVGMDERRGLGGLVKALAFDIGDGFKKFGVPTDQ